MKKHNYAVLVIDDEVPPREAVENAFKESKDCIYEVTSCKDVSEAESAMKNTKFDVIVVDIMLGGECGYEGGIALLQEAMVFATNPGAVKIVITGYPTYERCVKAMRAGAWDFIEKTGAWVERTVESALGRLRELEEYHQQESQIFEHWLPKNEAMLQEKYSNCYVAIQNDTLLASGETMISLGEKLSKVLKPGQSKPFILFVAKKGQL